MNGKSSFFEAYKNGFLDSTSHIAIREATRDFGNKFYNISNVNIGNVNILKAHEFSSLTSILIFFCELLKCDELKQRINGIDNISRNHSLNHEIARIAPIVYEIGNHTKNGLIKEFDKYVDNITDMRIQAPWKNIDEICREIGIQKEDLRKIKIVEALDERKRELHPQIKIVLENIDKIEPFSIDPQNPNLGIRRLREVIAEIFGLQDTDISEPNKPGVRSTDAKHIFVKFLKEIVFIKKTYTKKQIGEEIHPYVGYSQSYITDIFRSWTNHDYTEIICKLKEKITISSID